MTVRRKSGSRYSTRGHFNYDDCSQRLPGRHPRENVAPKRAPEVHTNFIPGGDEALLPEELPEQPG